NDASKLVDGKVQYSCLPNEDGGIVDDLLVYRWREEEYYLVVNASNIEKDWNWICKYNDKGVEMLNMSDNMSLLAIQGPDAAKTVQKLTKIDLSVIEYYAFDIGQVAGIDNVIVSNTGYTGAGGFELYVKNDDAEKLWDAVMEAGKEFEIMPCGLGCRDTLRLEMGFCLYGNDIDGGNVIGEVTSGTQSPSLNKAIGMGYVSTAFSKEGSEIYIQIRDKAIKAVVTKIPFLKK
ncbi:MAG: glycine cleavage system aminomethyltransferase GcvT, partial [Bacteroidetes bacterium]|nr:glycine cleavage system aminomethyltransferase GcvT [Bacteroidota bacterium]